MIMHSHRRRAAVLALLALPCLHAWAEPTPVTVRVLSQDAKFVGDGTGGATITLRAAQSGKVLATGLVRGGTGNTDQIMKSTGRSPLRASADAAQFTTTVDIDQPTLVELQVQGPLGRPSSAVMVSSQRWMLPGEAVTDGDGWSIELPGLAITPSVTREGTQLRINAKVEPMCGCPITPGGLWDSAHYTVTASLWQGNRQLGKAPLAFTTSPGGFQGNVTAVDAGDIMLIVFARNTVTGASGMAQQPVASH